jgi:hypothetical protein
VILNKRSPPEAAEFSLNFRPEQWEPAADVMDFLWENVIGNSTPTCNFIFVRSMEHHQIRGSDTPQKNHTVPVRLGCRKWFKILKFTKSARICAVLLQVEAIFKIWPCHVRCPVCRYPIIPDHMCFIAPVILIEERIMNWEVPRCPNFEGFRLHILHHTGYMCPFLVVTHLLVTQFT